MNGHEFLTKVVEHPELHIGDGPRDDRIYVVLNRPADRLRVGWELEPETIAEHGWEVLRDVLCCERRPDIMQHLARIVGYYAFMRNFNGSKLAEVADRHKGDYSIAEAA